MDIPWTKEAYEKTVSSRCWWFTPYDEGWDAWPALRADNELREIVAMEHALGEVPQWAREIVQGCLNYLPPCGHYLFPRPFLEVVSAIGSQSGPRLWHGCYTVERERKERMMDYALCLDAWLAGAEPEAAAAELGERSGVDWRAVCADLWQVLGEHSEMKDLLIERTLHRTRWWVKTPSWDDAPLGALCRDEYLGDLSAEAPSAQDDGPVGSLLRSGLRGPTLDEHASPRVRRLETRLKELCPDLTYTPANSTTYEWFRNLIVDGSWPCAPKAFRFLERLLWSIGKERPAVTLPSFPLENGDEVPGFLRCEDTYPNQHQASQWWQAFLVALRAWWRAKPTEGEVAVAVSRDLGEATPVKRWLVRLLVHRLELLQREGGHLKELVEPPPGARIGSGCPG